MRRVFIRALSRKTARKRCPWAASVVRVEGGCFAFESSADALSFKRSR